jgi:hypothetical protein
MRFWAGMGVTTTGEAVVVGGIRDRHLVVEGATTVAVVIGIELDASL